MIMRVLVVTTHRSDKAHYDRLLRILRGDERFRITLYACNRAYEAAVPKDPMSDMRPLARTRHKGEPGHFDAGVVLGDRYEMLVAAIQIVEARIPLVHIHGGEHTYGSLDERWRWAMTMLADEHCVAHDAAAAELAPYVPLGRIHITGAPGLDEITDGGVAVARVPRVIVLHNPVIDADRTSGEGIAIGKACVGLDKLEFMPNGDRYSDAIPWITRGLELQFSDFRNVLAAAQVIVGNSSAGIIEAPSLGTWAVNVGDRQRSRIRAGNVIDVPTDPDAIRAAILDALARPRFSGPNPYRHPEGKACEAIRDVLLGMAEP